MEALVAKEKVWQQLGGVDTCALVAAREEVHWAAQLLAASGFCFAEPRDDQSHTNMEWVPDELGFAGPMLRERDSLRLHLSVEELSFRLGTTGSEFSLEGQSLGTAYQWLAREMSAQNFWKSLDRPPYDMPAARAENVPFRADSAALRELARWYYNAETVLGEVVAAHEGASAVRCWPHHFDIATLIDSGSGKSIGVGMTPGDAGYDAPYWYVTPWPYPENPDVADLPDGGHWHREGWFGAVLTGAATAVGNGDEQAARVREFVAAAIGESQKLLASQ